MARNSGAFCRIRVELERSQTRTLSRLAHKLQSVALAVMKEISSGIALIQLPFQLKSKVNIIWLLTIEATCRSRYLFIFPASLRIFQFFTRSSFKNLSHSYCYRVIWVPQGTRRRQIRFAWLYCSGIPRLFQARRENQFFPIEN